MVNSGVGVLPIEGESYTIRMSLSDVLTFDGITVESWTPVDGGTLETE